MQPFTEDVQKLSASITSATLDLYKKIVQDLPPTPSKFHYIFNLRDLSRIFSGLCITTAGRFEKKEEFVRVWRNECLRVFHDRAINRKDKDYIQENISSLIAQNFGDTTTYVMREPILFGDYRNTLVSGEPRLYEDIQDFDASKGLFAEILDAYNEVYTPMNLVLFDDALDHLTRVHRVLRMNRGHALLVGVGGSGKQSISKLASYAAGCEVFEISLSRGYDETNFREDLKVLYHKLGIEGKKTTFLFTDSHVAEEGFLELINNMLTTGAVPALFPDDEKDGIINNMRDEAAKAGYPPGKEAIWNYFINKCADNLHIILAMSPTGDTLRVRCRNFPGLVNNTVIDWFEGWPTQALLAVASWR